MQIRSQSCNGIEWTQCYAYLALVLNLQCAQRVIHWLACGDDIVDIGKEALKLVAMEKTVIAHWLTK